MAKDNGSSFIEVSFAFLLGSLVGATIALLYAPAAGDETRKRIREASNDMQGNLRDQYGRIKDKAEIEISRMKDRAYEGVNRAKDYYGEKKGKVREAFEQGKRAFEQEQDKEEISATAAEDNT